MLPTFIGFFGEFGFEPIWKLEKNVSAFKKELTASFKFTMDY